MGELRGVVVLVEDSNVDARGGVESWDSPIHDHDGEVVARGALVVERLCGDEQSAVGNAERALLVSTNDGDVKLAVDANIPVARNECGGGAALGEVLCEAQDVKWLGERGGIVVDVSDAHEQRLGHKVHSVINLQGDVVGINVLAVNAALQRDNPGG